MRWLKFRSDEVMSCLLLWQKWVLSQNFRCEVVRLSEEAHELFGRERRGAGSVKDVFGQGALFAVELADALFRRVGGDQVVAYRRCEPKC